MIAALPVRWLLTAVLAAAGLGSPPPRRRAGPTRVADRLSDVLHVLMSVALADGCPTYTLMANLRSQSLAFTVTLVPGRA